MDGVTSAQGPALRCAWIYLSVILAAYAIVVLCSTRPPAMVDYPDWVYQGTLLHGVLIGHPLAGYVLKHYPVPNSLTTVGLGLLDCVLPWQWAGKLWIALYLALAGASIAWVSRALGVASAALLLAMPTLMVNLNFWYGHISFEIGVCLVLLLAGMLVRGAGALRIALLLTLLFFTHLEACACGLLLVLVGAYVLRRRPLLWSTMPAIALTVWYAAARLLAGNADARGVPTADYRYGSKAFLVYKANTFAKVFGYVNAQAPSGLSQSEHLLSRAFFVALLLASLVLSVLCLIAIARALMTASERPMQRILRVFVVSLFAISAMLPQIWLGVADPGSRLILMAALAGFLLIDWHRRTAYAIAILSGLLCMVNLCQFAAIQRSPLMAGHSADLPGAVLLYGHVMPATRLEYYDSLERRPRTSMDLNIFSTAMFLRDSTAPQQ